ncbi:RAB6-interacting golgin-like [Biomphalaria glabrata]|uniref:RAB6-interacting golgin n=1 Tax=Biomphalaria glabrata TaxID=6526 RepID=A0A9W2Z5R5_BIOGL|nr:RAB6-interacting golgin-like [Biomphalaria glabrata]
MAGWSGFSDEDLRKMRLASLPDSENSAPTRKTGKSVVAQRITSNKPASQNSTAPQRKEKNALNPNVITSENKQIDHQNKIHNKKGIDNKKETDSSSQPAVTITPSQTFDGSLTERVPESPGSLVAVENDIKELDEAEAFNVELSNVQKFQQQQKVIEEANKHKRALLAQAIENRRKKAKAEAEKLMRVQQELNHLDTLLTADVSIIRDRIEIASLEYNDAQKRYEKAEKEFIAAKMDLFAKGEVKEQLTEHLYTIIHQNEVRKAKKLVELMEKLAMEVTADEWELTIPAIPQLTNFTAVATLHGPAHGHSKDRTKEDEKTSPQTANELEKNVKVNSEDLNGKVIQVCDDEDVKVKGIKPEAQSSEAFVSNESQTISLPCNGAALNAVEQCEQVEQCKVVDTESPPPDVSDINRNIATFKTCEESASTDCDVNHQASKHQENVIATPVEEAATSPPPVHINNGWKHPFS